MPSMRLLALVDNERLRITEFFEDDIPSYAVLSHTWGSEEVTFHDLTDGSGRFKRKAGYAKIKFCGKQAAADGIPYFWVDTCCINKDSSADLQESINSMYQWYKKSSRCYVFMSDVSRCCSENTLWKSEFRESRWFSRGWTLQELLAPAFVEFFDNAGRRIGNLKELEEGVHVASGIKLSALRGAPLSDFSISERLSWAEGRKTTRKEDGAYCLMGLFDIHMPLLYGEGVDKAMKRLMRHIPQSLNGKSPQIPCIAMPKPTENDENSGELSKRAITGPT